MAHQNLAIDARAVRRADVTTVFICKSSAWLLQALRRARPLDPLPVMAVGALGVAALAAEALQFFHPFDVTVTDLALHGAAAGVVILASSAAAFVTHFR